MIEEDKSVCCSCINKSTSKNSNKLKCTFTDENGDTFVDASDDKKYCDFYETELLYNLRKEKTEEVIRYIFMNKNTSILTNIFKRATHTTHAIYLACEDCGVFKNYYFPFPGYEDTWKIYREVQDSVLHFPIEQLMWMIYQDSIKDDDVLPEAKRLVPPCVE